MWLAYDSDDSSFFFFNDTATTEIYTLSLHDALPIFIPGMERGDPAVQARAVATIGALQTQEAISAGQPVPTIQPTPQPTSTPRLDRKSTRLNSSHANISYAVFCLKKKKNRNKDMHSH